MQWLGRDRHVAPATLVDLLEGARSRSARRHLERCSACAGLLAAVAAARRDAVLGPVPEPPAGFWDQLSASVRRRIAGVAPAPVVPVRRLVVWLHPAPMVAVVAALVVLSAAAFLWRGPRKPAPPDGPAGWAAAIRTEAAADPAGQGFAATDQEPGPWDLVLALAEEVDLDEASEAGLGPEPGAMEHAVSHLSADERTELVRLIREAIGGV